MKLEIDLPEEAIIVAARHALGLAFKVTNYSHDQQPGYAAVSKQVAEVLANIDLRDMVKKEPLLLARGIVQEVVHAELKRMAREVIKRERDAGTLLVKEST